MYCPSKFLLSVSFFFDSRKIKISLTESNVHEHEALLMFKLFEQNLCEKYSQTYK